MKIKRYVKEKRSKVNNKMMDKEDGNTGKMKIPYNG